MKQATDRKNHNQNALTSEDKAILLEDEAQAWARGEERLRKAAPDLPSRFWPVFYKHKADRLDEYKKL